METFTIKPLRWVQLRPNNLYPDTPEEHVASTMFGQVQIDWVVDVWIFRPPSNERFRHHSLESAQLAAESWHRERILPALVRVGGDK